MTKIFWMAAIFLAVAPAAAQAAPTCYTRAEAEAEQGIRIHSELMVIGLNCQHRTPAGQEDYYKQYKKFTARHGRVFAGYETALIRYFQRAGYKNPEGALNGLRTEFANKISGDSATMRPDMFCKTYAGRIPRAAKMDEGQVRKWAGTFFPKHPVSKPVCDETARR